MAATFLKPYQLALNTICQRYLVKRLYAFGSVTGDAFDPQHSDIDFLVEFQSDLSPEAQGNLFFDLYFSLEDLFQRKIGLLINRPFRNPYFAQSVDQTKELVTTQVVV